MTADPVMLRVYEGDKKGATAFFRNRPFLQTIHGLVDDLDRHSARVLFHACSIGAEPYSFAAMASEPNKLTILAADAEESFLATAREGVYPADVLVGMTSEERSVFEVIGDRAQVKATVRNRVQFLPQASLLDFNPSERFDVVFAMNVLTYLTPTQQTEAIRNMAGYAKSYLCLTAFHPDQIRSDVEAVGFAPYLARLEQIHGAWVERIQPTAPARGTPEYSWVLPPFETTTQDYQWRYASIFRRI